MSSNCDCFKCRRLHPRYYLCDRCNKYHLSKSEGTRKDRKKYNHKTKNRHRNFQKSDKRRGYRDKTDDSKSPPRPKTEKSENLSEDSTSQLTQTAKGGTTKNQVGPTGPTGPQGVSGQPGDSGLIGQEGPTGPQGIIGTDGISGKDGSDGPRGIDGATGPTGLQGEPGPVGITTNAGFTGPTGPQGHQGLEGQQGQQGLASSTGATGPIGPQGIQGQDGMIGPQGLASSTGATGPIGPQGQDGMIGPQGPSGQDGMVGPQGIQGQGGTVGSQGPPGQDGTAGSQGIQGQDGTAGPQGLSGQDGMTGPQGPIGPQGLQGAQGLDGMDGLDGTSGPTGFTGPTGPSFLSTSLVEVEGPISQANYSINMGPEVFKGRKDACCPIITEFGLGSGFFIRGDGYICTCAHVILENGGSSPNDKRASLIIVDITNANGVVGKNIQVRCDVVGIDQAADIAVLKVRTISQDSSFGFDLTNQSSIIWGDSTTTPEGTSCYIIGQPEGIDRRSISHGTLRDNKFIATSNPLAPEGIFFDCPIHPGNSGSPVFDAVGRVIGIACYSYTSSTGNGGIISLEDMAGGTCQYITKHVTDYIVSNGTDYGGSQKGYLGLSSWAPCIGVELYNLRVNNPAFTSIGQVNGLVVKSLDTTGGTPGRRAHQATIPILVNDVLLEIQIKNQNGSKIKLGVYDQQYHIGRITWLNPPGTILTLTVIRPSTGQTFTTDIILDNYPNQKDVVFSSSNFKSIDTMPETAKLQFQS